MTKKFFKAIQQDAASYQASTIEGRKLDGLDASERDKAVTAFRYTYERFIRRFVLKNNQRCKCVVRCPHSFGYRVVGSDQTNGKLTATYTEHLMGAYICVSAANRVSTIAYLMTEGFTIIDLGNGWLSIYGYFGFYHDDFVFADDGTVKWSQAFLANWETLPDDVASSDEIDANELISDGYDCGLKLDPDSLCE